MHVKIYAFHRYKFLDVFMNHSVIESHYYITCISILCILINTCNKIITSNKCNLELWDLTKLFLLVGSKRSSKTKSWWVHYLYNYIRILHLKLNPEFILYFTLASVDVQWDEVDHNLIYFDNNSNQKNIWLAKLTSS